VEALRLAAEATEVTTVGGTAVVVKGIVAVVIAVLVFIGSVWLLLSLVLGGRLAYWLTASITFGIMVILSIIWFGSKLGPKGAETTWIPVGAGSGIQEVKGFGETYELGEYPNGSGWEAPRPGRRLVDGAEDTATEAGNAEPVLETFVSNTVSVIPGLREREASKVQGEIKLIPQEFALTDVRMREARVDGKPSLIAAARAVPADQVIADLGGVPEGEVVEVLTKPGDEVKTGQPILKAKAGDATVDVKSTRDGRIVEVALAKGDKIKPGVPFADIDISGQPGQPQPVTVVAARELGSVRTPPLYYLIVSLALFAIHMRGLARTERLQKVQAQPA